ncbi:nucleotidyltransferase family protein [Halomonas sp. IOP_31]|uniref:nucleotidyltransferase family protein n=1 Tax=Halomonas sp. IOP_31 TaxID=2876584 RepID=UPI001E5D59D9|nr:nucleotidyltransferase family protein [Halomonas sp. IOP_31]MCD6008193.1 nucleotidyltransferase family protein [Halomonas sp. IOP_31]
MKSISEGQLGAVVLAADRHADDPVAREAGVACKALTPVAGVPMLRRVFSALDGNGRIARICLAGPPAAIIEREPLLGELLGRNDVSWVENAATPSASVGAALRLLPDDMPVMVTTADHALLTPAIVTAFVDRALASDGDFVVGVARLETVKARFPGTRRTAIRLSDGPYCGCNLFAFTTPRGRALADFWRRVEQQRKRPWRVIGGALGWGAVVRYLLGRLTLEQALDRLSRRLGIRIRAVVLDHAEAAVDVDTPADRQLVEAILAGER